MSRQRSAVEWQDIVSATFVVGPDIIESDFLLIQEALDNLPVEGGSIAVLSGTYDELLTFPLKPVEIFGCGDATVLAPSTAGEIFAFPNGLTGVTHVVIRDMKISGDGALAQTAFAYKDVNSYWRLITEKLHITGVRKIDDVQARETTYVKIFEVHHYNPRFRATSTPGVNVLCATPDVAGTYNGATGIFYHDANLCDELGFDTTGWKYNFDGDTIFEGSCYIQLEDDSVVDGHEVQGSMISFALSALTLEVLGGSWFSFDSVQNQTIIGSFTLKLSGGFNGNVSHLLINGAGAGVILNRNGQKIDVSQTDAIVCQGVLVDVLAGADGCRVSGSFGDCVTAAVRTAAQKTVVAQSYFAQVTGKTVLETGAADSTVIDDCSGLTSGTGVTLIGGNSKINGSSMADKADTTTAALVSVVPTIVNPKGLVGVGTIKNTGGVNSIDVKESFTDAFGTTSSVTTTVVPGATRSLDLNTNIGTGLKPYVSYKAEVIDTVAGNHTTYVSHFVSQGALS